MSRDHDCNAVYTVSDDGWTRCLICNNGLRFDPVQARVHENLQRLREIHVTRSQEQPKDGEFWIVEVTTLEAIRHVAMFQERDHGRWLLPGDTEPYPQDLSWFRPVRRVELSGGEAR